MNLTVFAMRRPITLVMVIASVLGAGVLALDRMRVDIFPAINAPQIYVLNNYAGMDPSQIEGIITNVYELNFQYVDGLKGIESKNIQNMVMLKLTFYPGTDMAAAMSQVVSLADPCPGTDAAQRTAAVRDAFRRGERAYRLPGAGEQDPAAGRIGRPGDVQDSPHAHRPIAGHDLVLALWQQHAGDRVDGRSRPLAGT